MMTVLLTMAVGIQADHEVDYRLEGQVTTGTGDYSPLWLNANKYGLSSLTPDNGYLRTVMERPLIQDSLKHWGWGGAIDLAGAYNNTSSFIVQQAFVEGRWRKATLLVGSKQLPMELKNQQLSSGAQCLGINARPIPQVRIAYPDYVDVPLTRQWLQFKGHLAYGWFTDDGWQKDFTDCKSKFTEDVLYHSKAGFLKLQKPGSPFSIEVGMEMACQFGGESYKNIDGVIKPRGQNKVTLRSFFRALIPHGNDGDDNKDIYFQGAEGNHMGTWLLRLKYDQPSWTISLYGDHYFEDISAMFHLDYDNYTTGSKWLEKHGNRFLLYDFKDMLLGAEFQLKNFTWLNTVVIEYIYTKYQSGPVYHDHEQYLPDHIGGLDGYYVHGIYSGWQHWGQVIGNPLYQSPLYNTNGSIMVQNNRFVGFHIGLSGNPAPGLQYRLLCSTQKGYGTYLLPYDDPKRNLSLLGEATYALPERIAKGWSARIGIGYDHGCLRGNNLGMQLTIIKAGKLLP